MHTSDKKRSRLRLTASLPAPLLLLAIAAQALGQTPSFAPDKTFQGSNLDGWHTVGKAKWQANNGVIDADGRAGNASGWLFLDHPYQDTGLYAAFRCDGACDTGILLRAEKSGGSTQGLFLAIKGNDAAAYRVTLDQAGNEIGREKLRNAGGLIRFAPPSPSPADGPAPPLRRPMTPAPPGVTLPLAMPAHGLKENDWNDVEVLLDADLLRAFFDDGGAQVSTATENTEGFGPFALYVGAGTAVHFRNLAWKDPSLRGRNANWETNTVWGRHTDSRGSSVDLRGRRAEYFRIHRGHGSRHHRRGRERSDGERNQQRNRRKTLRHHRRLGRLPSALTAPGHLHRGCGEYGI
jgi:Domain of Unknown Function (DUF1080)